MSIVKAQLQVVGEGLGKVPLLRETPLISAETLHWGVTRLAGKFGIIPDKREAWVHNYPHNKEDKQ